MNKQKILKKAQQFPQAFRLLPMSDGKPGDQGTWAAYPCDEATMFWINSSHEEALIFYDQQIKEEEDVRMSKELTVQEKDNLRGYLTRNIKAIKNVIPKHLTVERFTRIAFTSISMNPAVANCSELSIINCVLESAMIGLEIGGPLSHCSLVPYKNKKVFEAQLIIEVAGKMELGFRSGLVANFDNHAVYQKDQFDYQYGLGRNIMHKPYDGSGDPGPLVYAYSIVHFISGGYDFEVINRRHAMEAKAKSASANSRYNPENSPWNQKEFEPSMWIKTAVHRLSKRFPKSPEFQRVQNMEEARAQGKPQDFGHVIDIDIIKPDRVKPPPPDEKGERTQNEEPKTDIPPEGEVVDAEFDETDNQVNQTEENSENVNQDSEDNEKSRSTNQRLSAKDQKIMKNLGGYKDMYAEEYQTACEELGIQDGDEIDLETAVDIITKLNEILKQTVGGNG